MAEIDKHSDTWRAVTDWAHAKHQRAVDALIAGSPGDDKLRGEIRAIDELLELTGKPPPPVPAAHYE
ncbi:MULTISPECIES: hypothetical protein [Halomonadaceae]|uniref:hypothetical protein n=1 Tax=Halomonadaceae TaxID=28256 RepID=UPI001598BBB8|nr:MULTISPECIES: hypothetical protein [Halomonas]QJQ93919.1 hypothetical protein HIO72_00485 [Halomonas sp. PA5]